MKKSEVIKLLKEGTHCIYNDCPDKEPLLMEITKEHVSRIYYRFYYRFLNGGVQASNFPFKGLEIINLSEIEPDNEKPKNMKQEFNEYMSNHAPIGLDCLIDTLTESDAIMLQECFHDFAKLMLKKENSDEKPHLFFEGEKYYFGEEYEFFNRHDEEWCIRRLLSFESLNKYRFNQNSFDIIRKIDHTSKYKTKLEELKQQAEKDGVNLKELI